MKREGNPPPPDVHHRPPPPPAPPALEPGKVLSAPAPAPRRTVVERLLSVMAEIDPVSKKKQSDGLTYPYRSIDDLYSACTSILAKHGVLFLPYVVQIKTEERVSKKETLLIYRILTVDYYVYGADGDSLEMPIRVIGEAMDTGDRASSKAHTTAEKVCLLTVFKIPTRDPAADPDRKKEQARAPAARPADRPAPAPRRWRHVDRYRFGNGEDRPLAEGTFEYLSNYARKITEGRKAGKDFATDDHIAAVEAEIERRKHVAETVRGITGLECNVCGGIVVNGVCTACGVVFDGTENERGNDGRENENGSDPKR